MPPWQITASRLTASNCSSNLATTWPPYTSRNSFDHGFQVPLQSHLITACMCIPNLAQLRPHSSHNGVLQVYPLTYSIMASKSISKLVRLWPPSWHNYGLRVHISNLAPSWPPSASPNCHDHELGVNLYARSIMAPMCISQLTQYRSPLVSPN